MKITHLASEFASLAKVGGLGDVTYGLSRAQVKSGHTVCVMLPYYQQITTDHLTELHILKKDLSVGFDGGSFSCHIWQGKLDNLTLHVVELLHSDRFFDRENIYGYEDDTSRFLAFVCACLAFFESEAPADLPDMVHLHDWPTSAFAALAHQRIPRLATLLTLHNVEHQGAASRDVFQRAGLEPIGFKSLLEMGLEYAGGLSAVSKTYLEEIQTPEGGRGLDEMLRCLIKAKPSRGIINGIDEEYWDPSNTNLPCPYDASSLVFEPCHPQALAKRANKKVVQQEFHLALEDRPLVVCIARLVPQKGLDLIEHALYQTLEQDGQFILLGTSPLAAVERHFRRLEEHLKDSERAHVSLSYTESLAMKLFAAADIILVPSLFEPCGLTQLIGFRYGALALVRETGGLKDTVIDVDTHPDAPLRGNGFTFLYPDFRGVNYALTRALNSYRTRTREWQMWVKRAMQTSVNWEKPSAEYLELYQEVIHLHLHYRPPRYR